MKELIALLIFLCSFFYKVQYCTAQSTQKDCNQVVLATDFLDEYISLDFDEAQNWVIQHSNVTECFKDTYREAINQEYVGADLILDAQDTPSDLCIEFVGEDYVVIGDQQWTEYRCYVSFLNGKIDGVGVINTKHIPGKKDNYKKTTPFSNVCMNELIAEVNEIRQTVNANLDNYRLTEIVDDEASDESTGGKIKKFYVQGNYFRKIQFQYFGELGNRKIEYYFDDSTRLRLYIDEISHYNAPMYISEVTEDGMQPYDPEKTKVETNSFYFNRSSDMFRWVNEDGNIEDPNSEKFKQKEIEINDTFIEFQ